MTLDELYLYIEQPERLNAESLPALKSLVETYPYCGTLVFLYLYNLARCRDLQYTSELKRLSPYLPDRRVLFQLVEGGLPIKKANDEDKSEDDAFSLIERFLGQQKASGEDLPSELNYGVGTSDRDDYFASEIGQASLKEKEEIPQEEKQAKEELKPLKTEQSTDKGEGEGELEEELFTETLAKIYIKQGKYDKALRIIRSISLNYPKKNRYFVNQIRFLELLVRNNNDNK